MINVYNGLMVIGYVPEEYWKLLITSSLETFSILKEKHFQPRAFWEADVQLSVYYLYI
jgi:hypothetical protein